MKIESINDYNILKENLCVFNKIKCLTICDEFEGVLDILPSNLEHIILEENFNGLLPVLPQSLLIITFKGQYDNMLPHLPDSLELIEFNKGTPEYYNDNYDYKLTIPNFPKNAKKIYFYDWRAYYGKTEDGNINNKYTFIIVGINLHNKLPEFPEQLESLIFNCVKYGCEFPNFPKTFKNLQTPYLYDISNFKKLNNIPILKVNSIYNHKFLNLTIHNIKYIHFYVECQWYHDSPNIRFKLPICLKKLKLSNGFNELIETLPINLEILTFECAYNYNIKLPDLPPFLKKIKYNPLYNHQIIELPDYLKYIKFPQHYTKTFPNLSNSLRFIKYPMNYNQTIKSFPEKIKIIKFGDKYNCEISNLPKSLKSITFGIEYKQKLPQFHPKMKSLKLLCETKIKLTNLKYVMNLIIKDTFIDVKKYTNLLFAIKPINDSHIIITRDLKNYMMYITFNNKIHIPYEIYYYIYNNFKFKFEN